LHSNNAATEDVSAALEILVKAAGEVDLELAQWREIVERLGSQADRKNFGGPATLQDLC
jgi:hypothetical protein